MPARSGEPYSVAPAMAKPVPAGDSPNTSGPESTSPEPLTPGGYSRHAASPGTAAKPNERSAAWYCARAKSGSTACR
ncbi:MAG: hypothetical protein IPJ65_01170 [Archangiaceae bacterium]|nr:hypothetical protein [Archangiaceae bacterium]